MYMTQTYHQPQTFTGETGTYRYMSSEVIRHEPYSTAADVYSFGVVLNELLTREQPFRGPCRCVWSRCGVLSVRLDV